MKQAVLIMACCLVGFPVWGQYSLSGTIRSTSGEKLVGAAIAIKNSYLGTSSGLEGEYRMEGLHEGTITLLVSYLGYRTQQKEVNPAGVNQLDFELEPASILADEVVVRAVRMNGSGQGASQSLNREELAEQNRGRDIPFLLSLTPSLVATSDAGTGIGYTNLRIRGTDSYRINVTVNGIPVNDAESHGVWWVNMPDFASSVDNIQVQRGAGGSTNGAAAFGGTISMQTVDRRENPYSIVSLTGGSFNTFQRNVMLGTGLLNKRFTLDARLSGMDSDGYIDRAFSHLKSWYVSAASYGKGSILRLNIFSGEEQTYQAWWGIDKEILDTNRRYNPYTYENETDNYKQTHYQLLFSKELRKNLVLNTALHYTHGEGYYESFVKKGQLADYNLLPYNGVDTSDLITRKWLDNDFYGTTYSLLYRKDGVECLAGGGWNRYIGNHFGQVIWAAMAANNQIRYEYYRNQGDKSDLNNYLKLTYKLPGGFSIHGDIQYRHIEYLLKGVDDYRDTSGVQVMLNQRHRFDFINPKLGIMYKLNSRQELYLTYSTARREPTRSNYTDATLQAVKPTPEILYDLEAGVSLMYEKFTANFNIFVMYYKDQLVHTGKLNDLAYPIMINVPESYRQGIELMARYQPVRKIQWDGNLSFSRNRILNFIEYADYYDADYKFLGHLPRMLGNTDISFSPGITGSSSLGFTPFQSLKLVWNAKYVGSQFFDNSSSRDRMIDPYFINDLRGEWVLHPGFVRAIALHVQVFNLFNVEYESNAYGGNWYENGTDKSWSCWFPQAGIHFLAGVRLEF